MTCMNVLKGFRQQILPLTPDDTLVSRPLETKVNALGVAVTIKGDRKGEEVVKAEIAKPSHGRSGSVAPIASDSDESVPGKDNRDSDDKGKRVAVKIRSP